MTDKLAITYQEREKQRIDKYLSTIDDERILSRSFIDKLIENGFVKVNNKVCKKNYKLSFNDKVEIIFPPKVPNVIEPLKLDLKIVYEDKFLLIIDKPWGLTVHPAPGHYNDTLVNALKYYYQDNLSSVGEADRPGIVHRLDKDTSGLIIIAKDDKTHLLLSNMFQKKIITKRYLAITVNVPDKKNGEIKTFINRDKRDRKKFAVSLNGKEAITHYRILENFEYFSLLEIDLKTGRTHQIRVHLDYINCPILGDEVYGGLKKTLNYIPQQYHRKVKGLLKNHLHRQALHSHQLYFYHPINNKLLDIKNCLKKWVI